MSSLLDRIDLHVEVTPVDFNELSSDRKAEASELIRKRVIEACEIQTGVLKKIHMCIVMLK